MYTVCFTYQGDICCPGGCDCCDEEKNFKFKNFRTAKKFFLQNSCFAKSGCIFYEKIKNNLMELCKFSGNIFILKNGKWREFKPTKKPD